MNKEIKPERQRVSGNVPVVSKTYLLKNAQGDRANAGVEIRRHRVKVEGGKRNSDEEEKKEVCSSEEVKENIEIKEEQPNNEKSERSKTVYCKVDVSKKTRTCHLL